MVDSVTYLRHAGVPVPPIMLTCPFSGGGARTCLPALPRLIVRPYPKLDLDASAVRCPSQTSTMPWVCYRRRNQRLRLALASFCLPLTWLARVVYLTYVEATVFGVGMNIGCDNCNDDGPCHPMPSKSPKHSSRKPSATQWGRGRPDDPREVRLAS